MDRRATSRRRRGRSPAGRAAAAGRRPRRPPRPAAGGSGRRTDVAQLLAPGALLRSSWMPAVSASAASGLRSAECSQPQPRSSGMPASCRRYARVRRAVAAPRQAAPTVRARRGGEQRQSLPRRRPRCDVRSHHRRALPVVTAPGEDARNGAPHQLRLGAAANAAEHGDGAGAETAMSHTSPSEALDGGAPHGSRR